MPNELTVLWTYLRARCEAAGWWDDAGSVVETVVLTAIFAALAIAIGAIIVSKVTAKANTIDLN